MLYAQVVLPLAQPMYTFSLDEGLAVEVGDAVVVQFGSSRYYTGIVWSITSERSNYPRIKPILSKLYGAPLIDSSAQRFWEWIADYYMCSVGEVMRQALPSLAKPSATSYSALTEESISVPMEEYVALAEELREGTALEEYCLQHERRSPRRIDTIRRIASLVRQRDAEDGYVPRRLIGVDLHHIAELRRRNLIVSERREIERLLNAEDEFLLPQLSGIQARALDEIETAHRDGRVALLHGVTGSGKTEIYMHLISKCLAAGKDVLLLVPEIVITSQLIERLERIFEGRTTTYHSHLTALRRGRTFLSLASSSGGELIVGVRSAIFLPMKHLGLVIVDEEHDPSYKQSDMAPRYNARDCAVVLAREYGASVVLGSATPSLESYKNALSGKYALVEVMERWGEGVLPEVIVSDTLRAVKRGERKAQFNLELLQNIERSLAHGEQSMLFQNRRGYSPYMQCRTCGYSPRCPHCNVTLTNHKGGARMECHYCGYSTPISHVCPNCQTQDMALMGFGTERVEEEVSRLYPEARVARLDGDTSTSERAFKSIVQSFERGEKDIMVGTQIITKGFDFGGVTTVGILNADNLLSAPDFRASERAFQLMMQVAGRAGRRNNRGRVVIQTAQPTHPVIRYVASGDYRAMACAELQERKAFGYPPYSRVVRIMVRHADYELLHHAAHYLAQRLRHRFAERVMGPVSSALEMLRGEHRGELLLKIESGASMRHVREHLRQAIKEFEQHPKYKGIKVVVDVDAW